MVAGLEERLWASFVPDLAVLVALPTVSRDVGKMPALRECAEWLRARLVRAGLAGVHVDDEIGPPMVYGEKLVSPDRPTVLVYAHYDVQPAGEGWTGDPFVMRREGDRVVGRGTLDDKGPLLLQLLALETAFGQTGGLGVNVKVILDGEEENGSRLVRELSRRADPRVTADFALISDTWRLDESTPTLCYGLRGGIRLTVTVRTGTGDVHSGTFGGSIPNSAAILARLLATLHDDDGRIAVTGFYDDVSELAAEERARWAALPFEEGEYCRLAGTSALAGEVGYSTYERTWARPTLEILSLRAGSGGNVVPAAAFAMIGCRLVPDQDPARIARIVEAHLRERLPVGAELRLELSAGGRATVMPIDHPALQAMGRALERGYGRPVALVREGVGIPFVGSLIRRGIPTVLPGAGRKDANAHGPDEWFELTEALAHLRSLMYFWEEVKRLERQG